MATAREKAPSRKACVLEGMDGGLVEWQKEGWGCGGMAGGGRKGGKGGLIVVWLCCA